MAAAGKKLVEKDEVQLSFGDLLAASRMSVHITKYMTVMNKTIHTFGIMYDCINPSMPKCLREK